MKELHNIGELDLLEEHPLGRKEDPFAKLHQNSVSGGLKRISSTSSNKKVSFSLIQHRIPVTVAQEVLIGA